MSRPGNRRPDVLPDLPPGARVVLVLPSGPDLAALLLECLDRHLVAVPLGPRTERWRIEEIVDRVGAAAVVTEDGTAATGRHTDRDDTGDLALVMFTSGSTGAPKGVMLPRDAVFANARATARLHGFTPDRPHATCLPLFHCNALVMSLVGTHLTGTPLVLHPRFDPEDYFADIARNGVRTASVVPSLLPDLLDAAPDWPEGLEYLITAAAPLTAEVAARFHELYGPRLRQGYGLTELMNFSFTTPVLDADRWRAEYLDGHPPVGEALPGTELRLEAGEVWIRSADRMRGYWDDPDATAAALTPDGWLRTGDLGRRRGDLLVLDGRSTERIDRGGEKFYPLDVERSWREAGLTGTFAAVGVPDDVLGHEIGLVTAENSAASRDAVRRIAEQGPMRPGAVALGGFAATSTGKPQRSAMGRALVTGRVSAARLARSRDAVTVGAPGPAEIG
ncbi:MAG: class I adenylate-forming enzyme family protein, partial [Pseudonocardia sediminis]